MHRTFGRFADHLGYLIDVDARREPPRAIDIRLRHRAASVGLEGDAVRHPALAEAIGQLWPVSLRSVGERLVEAVRAFEHGAGTDEAGARQIHGADRRLRGPARMEALGPGSFGEILDDAGGHRADDAERVDHLRGRQPLRSRHARSGTERAEHGGRMETRFVNALRRHEARAAHELRADSDAGKRICAFQAIALPHREHRRNDDGAGVDRPALESIVEVLAVRRSAVDEGSPGRVERALMADRGAAARAFPAAHGGTHVIAVSRRDAKAGDIDDELLGGFAKGGRGGTRAWHRSGELLGDGF